MSLTAEQRQDVRDEWCRVLSGRREPLANVTKADLLAAAAAMDDWVEANSAALNTAIPQPARAELTAGQKAELFAAVVLARYRNE